MMTEGQSKAEWSNSEKTEIFDRSGIRDFFIIRYSSFSAS